MKATSSTVLGISLAIIAANLFSSKVLLVKLAYLDGASPIQMLAIRMAVALPFFLVMAIVAIKETRETPLTGKDLLGMSLLGLMGYYLASLLDFYGMQYLSAGMERLILYLYPTLLVLIRSCVERTFPQRKELLALALAYSGTGLVYYEEQRIALENAWIGALLVFGSAIAFALYLYLSSGYIQRYGSKLFASWSSTVSCIAILLHPVIAGTRLPEENGLHLLILGVSLGIFCTVLPTFAMHHAISLIGSAKVGILGTSGILFPLFVGYLLFSEPLSFLRMAGAALVISAVVILSWKRSGSR